MQSINNNHCEFAQHFPSIRSSESWSYQVAIDVVVVMETIVITTTDCQTFLPIPDHRLMFRQLITAAPIEREFYYHCMYSISIATYRPGEWRGGEVLYSS